MPIGYTTRGFADYANFVDTYGATVTVRQSSSALVNRVWVFIEKQRDDRRPDSINDGAAHLSKPQAIELVRALQEWIATAEDDDPDPDAAASAS